MQSIGKKRFHNEAITSPECEIGFTEELYLFHSLGAFSFSTWYVGEKEAVVCLGSLRSVEKVFVPSLQGQGVPTLHGL